MAKKARKAAAVAVNKSEAIRAYAQEHPGAKPKAIAEALSKQLGEEVKAGTVSTVLYAAKKAGGAEPAKRGPKPQAQATAASNGKADLLDAAVAFAQAAGGLDQAEAMLAKLRAIKSL